MPKVPAKRQHTDMESSPEERVSSAFVPDDDDENSDAYVDDETRLAMNVTSARRSQRIDQQLQRAASTSSADGQGQSTVAAAGLGCAAVRADDVDLDETQDDPDLDVKLKKYGALFGSVEITRENAYLDGEWLDPFPEKNYIWRGKTWARVDGYTTSRGDKHPWCVRSYVYAKLKICGEDDTAPFCIWCEMMTAVQRDSRTTAARTYRTNVKEGKARPIERWEKLPRKVREKDQLELLMMQTPDKTKPPAAKKQQTTPGSKRATVKRAVQPSGRYSASTQTIEHRDDLQSIWYEGPTITRYWKVLVYRPQPPPRPIVRPTFDPPSVDYLYIDSSEIELNRPEEYHQHLRAVFGVYTPPAVPTAPGSDCGDEQQQQVQRKQQPKQEAEQTRSSSTSSDDADVENNEPIPYYLDWRPADKFRDATVILAAGNPNVCPLPLLQVPYGSEKRVTYVRQSAGRSGLQISPAMQVDIQDRLEQLAEHFRRSGMSPGPQAHMFASSRVNSYPYAAKDSILPLNTRPLREQDELWNGTDETQTAAAGWQMRDVHVAEQYARLLCNIASRIEELHLGRSDRASIASASASPTGGVLQDAMQDVVEDLRLAAAENLVHIVTSRRLRTFPSGAGHGKRTTRDALTSPFC